MEGGGKQAVKIGTNQPVLSKYLIKNSVEKGRQSIAINFFKCCFILLGNHDLTVIPGELNF